jgi:hypothetical protein
VELQYFLARYTSAKRPSTDSFILFIQEFSARDATIPKAALFLRGEKKSRKMIMASTISSCDLGYPRHMKYLSTNGSKSVSGSLTNQHPEEPQGPYFH